MLAIRLVGSALALAAAAARVEGASDPAPVVPYTQAIPGTDVSFRMVPVPGGVFTMGSRLRDEHKAPDQTPAVEVEVEPFYMGEHEVTWGEYEPFLQNYHRLAGIQGRPPIPADKMADAVTYPTPFYELEGGPVLDRVGRGGRFPAAGVSHFDARQYTKWLSKKTGRFYRLPTEAEWEYACRAGAKTAYSFGDDPKLLDDYGWFYDNSKLPDGEPAYREVGTKNPNQWGLYDMHGNVAEWCIDQYHPRWYRQFKGLGRVKAPQTVNWPNKKHPRAIRGGSYDHEAADCRSAARIGSSRVAVDYHNVMDIPESPHWSTSGFWIGFRVVSPATEPPEAEKLRYWNADDPITQEAIRGSRELHELVEPAAAPARGR
jgi:formylglycine-generating enzyme required for sulfatase activity